MNKKLAFIESNTTGTGFLFIKKARDLGYDVLFLTANKKKYSFLKQDKSEENHADVKSTNSNTSNFSIDDFNITLIEVNTSDAKILTDLLKSCENLRGVFSSSEYFISVAAAVAQNLQLPGNDCEAISNCRNKRKFYELLDKGSFLVPKTLFVKNLDDLFIKEKAFTFPLVVKPISGTGSIGVKKCLNHHDLIEHASCLLKEEVNQEGILIQEYFEGEEFSAEVIVSPNGIYRVGITKKYTTNDLYFIETGHDFPAKLLKDLEIQIWDQIIQVLRFLKFSFGPAHIEFKLRGSKVVFIEVNPRLAGGMIPQLISYACGIDICEIVLNLYVNKISGFPSLQYKGSSIRFFVVNKKGTIIRWTKKELLMKCKNVVEVSFNKEIGSKVVIYHDYRDRIGYLITRGEDSTESKEAADNAIKFFKIEIEDEHSSLKGRLSEGPHPLIQQIIRKKVDSKNSIQELEKISNIDIAYILMLSKRKIIKQKEALLMIQSIKTFQNHIPDLIDKLDFSRGNYYAYESFLRSELGLNGSGNNHIGRSRNDINSTLFYLASRESFKAIFRKILLILETILSKAKKSKEVLLPIYSQHQPAMPGNYSLYLLGNYQVISRILNDLISIEPYLNKSPLGTGSGCGTDIPIDTLYVANLLGFEGVFENSFDAISNRDFALRYRGILANLSMTLSRIAQDYQLWTTQEFNFFEMPDNLCGSSSMMPQKKNPYILEIIKSKAMDVIAMLFATYGKMHKVPMGNSIEVSSSSYDTISSITEAIIDILDLLILVIDLSSPISKNILKANKEGLTIANYAANQLMKKSSVSFREAHLLVGEIIRNSNEKGENVFNELAHLVISNRDSSDEDLLKEIVENLAYGGGPGSVSIALQIQESQIRFSNFSDWIECVSKKWDKGNVFLNKELQEFQNLIIFV